MGSPTRSNCPLCSTENSGQAEPCPHTTLHPSSPHLSPESNTMLLEQWLLKPGIEGSASPFDLTSSSLSPKSSVSSPPPPTLVQHSNNALISEWLMKPISYPPLFPPEPGSLDIQPVFTRLDPTIAFGLQTRLNKYMAAMERPLISREEPMWDMEDPDLMPTLNDWILCHRMMTDDGKTNPISGEYDAEAFLFEFYQLPPVLRLTRCAIAATYHLTQTEAFEYYRRARKAFSKAGSEPSLELIRAYIAVNGFAMNMLGQPLVGLQFLKLAVTMIRDIKLYIDPDDSPWLDYLNLTERQKEDRRRAFWQVYFYYVWHQTICNDSDYIDIELSCDKIKGPNSSFTMFRTIPTRKDYCAALGLIAKIKRLNSIPPSSITELVTSSSIVDFESQLISIQASVPDEMKLWAKNPTTITAEEEAEFVKKSLATNDKLCSSNMLAQTAISLLYRPIMFLSSLKQLHPLLLSPTEQQIVSNSIYRCLSSALRISNLFSLARKHNAGPDPFEILDTTECLFECFVVIWFTICRMGSGWAGVVAPLIPDFGSLRAQLADIVEFMRENDSGYNSPTLVSIVAMLQEIDRVRSGQSSLNLSDEVSGLEVGMQVMSIGADFGDPAEEIVAPYAFLGLLGLDVEGGVRWKGRSEESWRLFWKLYK